MKYEECAFSTSQQELRTSKSNALTKIGPLEHLAGKQSLRKI